MSEPKKGQVTQELIEGWLVIEDDEFYVDKFRAKYKVAPDSINFHMAIQRLEAAKKLKRIGRGLYRKIKEIKPIRWQDADETKYFDFNFPRSHGGDNSFFGFSEHIRLSPGNLIVITGVSNTGKSALALNILGENVDTNKCVLMGNEYATLEGLPSPQFKRRMKRMTWVEWFKEDGECKFQLLPIAHHYEDHIRRGEINIIDWINLDADHLYKIGNVIEDIKSEVGDGIAVVVLQKSRGAELGRGGQFTEDMADVYLTIDPLGSWESRLTVGKIKDSKRYVTGQTWAYKIVDGGANLHDIREIIVCPQCKGKGWKDFKKCEGCNGAKYINKDQPVIADPIKQEDKAQW